MACLSLEGPPELSGAYAGMEAACNSVGVGVHILFGFPAFMAPVARGDARDEPAHGICCHFFYCPRSRFSSCSGLPITQDWQSSGFNFVT